MRLVSRCRSRRLKVSVALVGVLVLSFIGLTVGAANAQIVPAAERLMAPGSVAGAASLVDQLPGLPGSPPNPIAPAAPDGSLPALPPEQMQAIQQQLDQDREQYINLLAKNLNLDPSVVKAAMAQTQQDVKAARIASIQQEVVDGKLSQEQADLLIQAVQTGPDMPLPSMGPMPTLPMPPVPGR